MDKQSLPAEVDQVLTLAQQALAKNLLAAYVYGSAVVDGLRPHSDLDVLVVVASPTEERVRRQLVAGLLELAGSTDSKQGPSRPLEVTVVVLGEVRPWRYPPTTDFQFGEWLRMELVRGSTPRSRRDPDLTILLHSALLRSLPLVGPPAARRSAHGRLGRPGGGRRGTGTPRRNGHFRP